MTDLAAAREKLESLHAVQLGHFPSPIDELSRLRDAIGLKARLLAKRDDQIPFGFGGNKVRKLRLVAAQAIAEGSDTLITTGGIQSNHARATSSVAAKMGLGCVLVANGSPQPRPTGNALLDRLLGAEIRYVDRREDRGPAMEDAARELRGRGRRPYVIPLGASTPLGAAAFALAIGELLAQMPPPDVIVCSTSSGGTQAGLVAGCVLHGIATRVIGVSADDSATAIAGAVRGILDGLEKLIEAPGTFMHAAIDVDDRFVGEGYGIPTPASTEALELAARREAIFLDPTYTAKAMAGLIARLRARELKGAVLFWHTGGQTGLFA
jgi:1-aminocyclopropane-1-carboxylate deaminase/D-cysteine desulfhydrase-like pyridoxal-dependent ACC family enzyme